jgi:hypothetical protein
LIPIGYYLLHPHLQSVFWVKLLAGTFVILSEFTQDNTDYNDPS